MEIIASTASNSPASRPADGEISPDNFFDASDKPTKVNVCEQADPQSLQQTHSQQYKVVMNG